MFKQVLNMLCIKHTCVFCFFYERVFNRSVRTECKNTMLSETHVAHIQASECKLCTARERKLSYYCVGSAGHAKSWNMGMQYGPKRICVFILQSALCLLVYFTRINVSHQLFSACDSFYTCGGKKYLPLKMQYSLFH